MDTRRNRKRTPGRSGLGACLLLGTILGCGGPPEKEESGDPTREQRLASYSSKTLAETLQAQPGGRVVWQAIEAHGGWDAWIAQGAHSYRRDAVPAGRAPVPAAAKSDERNSLGPVPFLFAAPELKREYLGVEWSSDAELSFDKVRVTAADPTAPHVLSGAARGGELEHIAFFDQTSGLLRRLLTRRSARWELRRFSHWKRMGRLRLATQAQVYVLERRYSHRGEEPDWTESLVEGVGDS